MKKIVKSKIGCISLVILYVEPGTTEEEIRQELPEVPEFKDCSGNPEEEAKHVLLVKSSLGPEYHKGYECYKVFEAEDKVYAEDMDNDDWKSADERINDDTI